MYVLSHSCDTVIYIISIKRNTKYRDIDLIWSVDSNRDVSWTYSVFRYTTYVKTCNLTCFLSDMDKIQGEI